MGKSEQCGNTALTLSDLLGDPQLPDKDSNTRLIPLTQGQFAIVDAADFEWLNQWKWCAFNCRGKWSATRGAKIGEYEGKRPTLHMHREIMKPPPGLVVDHRDGNGLNNIRSNLRLATVQQNSCNRGPAPNNRSGFKGVGWSKPDKRWRAIIAVNGKRVSLGFFDRIEDAAKAYRDAAPIVHGEFARWEPFSQKENADE